MGAIATAVTILLILSIVVFVLRVVCVQYEVLGPRKSAMPLVRDFSENDNIFRREKKIH